MIKHDTLAFRTLVTMARQRPEFDEPRCHALLEMVATTDKIRALVRNELQSIDLTEVQFAVLVVLLALDPEPVLPTTLAEHTCVTRAAITDAIDHLQALALAERRHSKTDRRNRLITLTKSGRETADKAAVLVLHALARMARRLEDPAPRAILILCDKLMSGAAPATSF